MSDDDKRLLWKAGAIILALLLLWMKIEPYLPRIDDGPPCQ